MATATEGFSFLPVYRFDGRQFSGKDIPVVSEVPLQIHLNGRHMATIACTGLHLDELALGYLKSEGFITTASDITEMRIDAERGTVHLRSASIAVPESADGAFPTDIASSGARSRITGAGCGPFEPLGPEGIRLSPQKILRLMDAFIERCPLHALTRGTHGAALTDGEEILVVREDIGRHNALDMLAGHTMLNRWNCAEKAILRTGRISREIVHKVWNLGIPVVVSLAVPTLGAIALATEAGITLVGALRGNTMNVYTHERRIGP